MYAVPVHSYQPGEPRWRDCRRWLRSELSGAEAAWLLDPGSLTARLLRASGGDFRVEVLSQQWRRPRLSERRLLDMQPRQLALVREVALLCRGEPWVFARSVMPMQSLTGRLYRLRKFDNRSLGAMLFSDPGMRRSRYEIARLSGHSAAIPPALRCDALLWGRRSKFYIDDKPIMVSEIFLPGFKG